MGWECLNSEADVSQASPGGMREVLLKTLYAASTAFSLPVLAESDQTFSIHAQQLIPGCQLAILEEES